MTVGPFAMKKHEDGRRTVVEYQPSDLKRSFPQLAKGTFGVVFLGKVKGFAEDIVIKDMEVQNQASIVEWQKEVRIMTVIQSPYIAQVYGYCKGGGVLTIVMEYMCNGDLFGILHKRAAQHPLSLIQRMRMARHVAIGLKVMHDNGFIHRDMKSMNILVDKDYTCKLTDFGLSKLLGSEGSFPGNVYHTMAAGTPFWMAPEVKTGVYSFPADIYSLGLVLFELFEKKLPSFNDYTQVTSLPAKFQSSPCVLPCVNPDPKNRPKINQLIDVLEGLIKGIVSRVKEVLSAQDGAEVEKVMGVLFDSAKATGQGGLTSTQLEEVALYQVLQTKSVDEADAYCRKAGISPGVDDFVVQPRFQAGAANGAPNAQDRFKLPQPRMNTTTRSRTVAVGASIRGENPDAIQLETSSPDQKPSPGPSPQSKSAPDTPPAKKIT